MGQLNLKPLTCSADDARWSVELFKGIENIEGISTLEVSNEGAAKTFELQSPDKVKLGS